MFLVGWLASWYCWESRLPYPRGSTLLWIPVILSRQRAPGSKRVKAHLLLNSLSPEQMPISSVYVPLAKMKHVALLDAGVLACVAPGWVVGPQQQPYSGEGTGAGISGGPSLVFATRILLNKPPNQHLLGPIFFHFAYEMSARVSALFWGFFWWGEEEKQPFFSFYASNSYILWKHWFRISKLDLRSCISPVLLIWKEIELRHCAYIYIEIAAKVMAKKTFTIRIFIFKS